MLSSKVQLQLNDTALIDTEPGCDFPEYDSLLNPSLQAAHHATHAATALCLPDQTLT